MGRRPQRSSPVESFLDCSQLHLHASFRVHVEHTADPPLLQARIYEAPISTPNPLDGI
jgi:hypothetical protein